MNWKEIKDKYPKAFQLGQDWWINNAEDYEPEVIYMKISDRFLYDFFDKQGIYIDVTVDLDGQFKCDILNGECDYIWCEKDNQDSRTKAEEQAFLKAFEILEDKLK